MPKRKPTTTAARKKPESPEVLLGFAARLREAMEDEDLNATQLAELASVSTQFVTRALKGERRDGMQAASAIKVANALGVRVGWLIAGESPQRGRVSVTAESGDTAEIVRATLAAMGYEAPRSEVSENKLLGTGKDSQQVPSG